MMRLNIKIINLFLFLLACGLLGASFYFQYVEKLAPCTLCIMQRAMVMVLVLLTLIGIFLKRRLWIKLVSLLQIFTASLGLFFASRQVWLQHLPLSQSTCGPDLQYMVRFLPWKQVIKLMFQGSGDCGLVTWRWLGITMPEWMLLFFVFFGLMAVVNFLHPD